MITIIYSDGRRRDFYGDDQNKVLEFQLAIACYADDYQVVQKMLIAHPNVDVNAVVIHSKSRGNGTPLVLTGTKAIAELLVKHGARVNHPCNYSPISDKTITPSIQH